MIRGCRAAPRSKRPVSHGTLLSVQENSPDTRSILTLRHPWRLSHPSHRLSAAGLAIYQLPGLQMGQDQPKGPGQQKIGGTRPSSAEDLGKGPAETTSPSMLCSVSAGQEEKKNSFQHVRRIACWDEWNKEMYSGLCSLCRVRAGK